MTAPTVSAALASQMIAEAEKIQPRDAFTPTGQELTILYYEPLAREVLRLSEKNEQLTNRADAMSGFAEGWRRIVETICTVLDLTPEPDPQDVAAAVRSKFEAAESCARQAAENADEEMERVKACEHIASGDEGWEVLRNLCPSTAAVAQLRERYERAMDALMAQEALSSGGITTDVDVITHVIKLRRAALTTQPEDEENSR